MASTWKGKIKATALSRGFSTGAPAVVIQFGLGMMYPALGIIERIGPDWDWVRLDGQHGQLGYYDVMLSMVRVCDLVQKPANVRVAGHESGRISQVLDMGIRVVIVLQVDTVEQALAMVRVVGD